MSEYEIAVLGGGPAGLTAALFAARHGRSTIVLDFAPLTDVLPHHQVVLGLVTTKDGTLEDADDLLARVEEATQYVPLERLAVSPQCGFASGAVGVMTAAQQEAKLKLIGDIAQRVWA